MNNTYLKNLNKERERLIPNINTKLEKFEFSVIDDMAKAEANSKELVKSINASMKFTKKLFKEMEKYAKDATKEINSMIKKYNAEMKTAGKVKDELIAQAKINSNIIQDARKGAKALGLEIEDIKGYKSFDKADDALIKAQGDDEFQYMGETLSNETWTVA